MIGVPREDNFCPVAHSCDDGFHFQRGQILSLIDYHELIGDAAAAYYDLGWSPQTSFRELVSEMVAADLELLGGSAPTGITLTESFAMAPGSAVSGLIFSHAQSRYFTVGPIGDDQAEDYARRKGLAPQDLPRLLGASLA